MRNRIRTILAILLAAVFLLTGCRIFKKDVHTVLTLTNAALTNVAEVESAEVKIRGTGDLNATYEALNIGLNMKLGTDMDLEMTRKPERTRGTAAITIGAIGQEQVIDGVLYKDTAGTEQRLPMSSGREETGSNALRLLRSRQRRRRVSQFPLRLCRQSAS